MISPQKLSESDFDALSYKKKVNMIIDAIDSARMNASGGYPSDYVIENGRLYWATLDDFKEYNAPQLIVRDVEDFVEENAYWVVGE